MNTNVCSLFAGIGGFDLGFQRSGLNPVVHVEINADCRKVLAVRFPDSITCDDVRKIPALLKRHRQGKPISNESRRLLDALLACGTICGGFPCQDLSVAGLRAGLAGERSGLWYVFRRIVALLRPARVVIENVPGLLSSNDGEDISAILEGLEELRYRWAYRTLDAQYFNVAQRRARVFIVASLGTFDERHVTSATNRGQCEGDVAGTQHSTPHSIVTTLAIRGRGDSSELECRTDGTANAILTPTGGRGGIGCGAVAYRTSGNCGAFEQGDKTGALNCGTDPNQTIIAFSGKDHGADAAEVSPTLRAMGHDGSHANGGGQVAIATKMAVRRLTPKECLRLQGFPDDWLDGLGISDSAKYRMCGNAVNVAVSEWIGARIVNLL